MDEMLRLSLEVQRGSDPIIGSLSRERGVAVPFHGWMEFAATLQALVEAQAPDTDQRAQAPGDL